ncbi:helix-turn-helix transcriptional regulator [Romboutsia sp. 1001216sp1]|uniref:helix-turn-helix domain-containing protein n=1 Tax=unclassified Romboutsia TaxID=2626894 RepID=UPI0018A0DD00|nr:MULTISPECIES: helix-turn-helix transcriptional regulator [unclassified Romboutsia]MDB8790666.1 helix-turn-helix transcriptional regulator [Romboutsia sp. 1001216sp1]MDB8803229.1 helix-turn-helix transcriptional regulator [Romboutsia sp. 1001216sp1]MDB8814607.1 helix-turn-helix transcriptional regulator [Romboutsia sp. 1001216sp1]
MFGKRLKTLRKDFKLTQAQLGKNLNLSQRTISGYENGLRFPDEQILNSIADYFDVSVDYLLGRTNIKNIYNQNRH